MQFPWKPSRHLGFIHKNLGFIQTTWFLVKKNHFYSKTMILFKKSFFLHVFFQKKLISHLFHEKQNQPHTFSERFSHADVNEFDDWRAPSHCKTFGLIFRKWIGMEMPKWLINSGLDCIFLKIGSKKKKTRSNGWALGLTTFFLLFVNMHLKTAKPKI